MRWLFSLVALAIISHASNFTAAAQDAAAERFKQRRNAASSAAAPAGGNTGDVTNADSAPAPTGSGVSDYAGRWYERRLALARGGQNPPVNSATGEVVKGDAARGITPELRARMARDPRYRALVIGYMQSMVMLNQTLLNAGQATANSIRGQVRSRERQTEGFRRQREDRESRERLIQRRNQ